MRIRILIIGVLLLTMGCKKDPVYKTVKANASEHLYINGTEGDRPYEQKLEVGKSYTIVTDGPTTKFLSVWVESDVVYNGQSQNKITFVLELK